MRDVGRRSQPGCNPVRDPRHAHRRVRRLLLVDHPFGGRPAGFGPGEDCKGRDRHIAGQPRSFWCFRTKLRGLAHHAKQPLGHTRRQCCTGAFFAEVFGVRHPRPRPGGGCICSPTEGRWCTVQAGALACPAGAVCGLHGRVRLLRRHTAIRPGHQPAQPSWRLCAVAAFGQRSAGGCTRVRRAEPLLRADHGSDRTDRRAVCTACLCRQATRVLRHPGYHQPSQRPPRMAPISTGWCSM